MSLTEALFSYICLAFRRDMTDFEVSVSILEPSFFRATLTLPEIIAKQFQETRSSLSQTKKDDYGQEFFETG